MRVKAKATVIRCKKDIENSTRNKEKKRKYRIRKL